MELFPNLFLAGNNSIFGYYPVIKMTFSGCIPPSPNSCVGSSSPMILKRTSIKMNAVFSEVNLLVRLFLSQFYTSLKHSKRSTFTVEFSWDSFISDHLHSEGRRHSEASDPHCKAKSQRSLCEGSLLIFGKEKVSVLHNIVAKCCCSFL